MVLAMGNPYLATDFPTVENYICSFSNTSVSEVAVVKALFGEIPIHGHLPVTIPVSPRAALELTVNPTLLKELQMPAHHLTNLKIGCIAVAVALLLLPACSVNVKKGENGEDKKVDIHTPVGDIKVDKERGRT